MTTTEKLTDFAVGKSFRDIPSSVVHDTKRIILDGIGCALGGFGMKNCSQIITDVVRNLGGPAESTIIGNWSRVSCAGATYGNAKLGNLMDMDDVFLNIGHQSPMVLYPALSTGERERSSGKEFLAAVAIGFDVSSRVVLGIGTLFDVVEDRIEEAHATGMGQGIFGGAVSAGRLLKLNRGEMINAIGIAGLYTPAPLSYKSITDMSMSKYQLEWGAMGAIFAALLAKNGFEGPKTILDDDLYAKGFGKKTYLKEVVEADLGDKWYISDTSLKPYPTCRHIHYALDLVSKVVKEERLEPKTISRVVIRGLGNYKQSPWNNYEPRNEFELQFSLPFALAIAAHQIKPGPKWLSPALLKDENLRDFAKKVVIEVEPEITELIKRKLPLPTLEIPTSIKIIADGMEYSATTRNAKGDGFSMDLRMTDEEVIEKFKENASSVLRTEKIEGIIQKVFHLEELEGIQDLFRF